MYVLLVDDHELIWNGTRRLLQRIAEDIDPQSVLRFDAVRDVDSACARKDDPPNLVLLDYHLPGAAGLVALQRIQACFGNATICMLSAEGGGSEIREVLDAGAAGFIPKSYTESEMESALRLVLRHKVYVPAEFVFTEDVLRGHEVDEVSSEDLTAFLRSELSARQRQVLALAIQGLPNKTIASELQIAEGTVKVHLSMVYRALGVKNRVGALCRVLHADAAGGLL
jgi:DNA-binding NarL/FixJ family response regulator